MRWSFYNLTTGHFTGRQFSCSAHDKKTLRLNTPKGSGAIVGDHDHLSRKVNLTTGNVVNYRPPKPDINHEWNRVAKRWILNEKVREQRHREKQAQASIEKLERQQLRPIRELMLNPDDADVKQRLADIDSKIQLLRKQVIGN